MKKLKIKVNTLEIEAIIKLLSIVDNRTIRDRDFRVARSVLLPLVKRLTTMVINDHPKTKKMTFSMVFHEAHYLEKFLQDFNYWSRGDYEYNVILKSRNELHQLLE